MTARLCPHCGARIWKMNYGLIKTSCVLIAADDVQAVYSSLLDVPAPLRKRLEASTTGKYSGTVVIADRRGKEEIEKASRLQRIPPSGPVPQAGVHWNHVWPALIALTIGAAGTWLAFLSRW